MSLRFSTCHLALCSSFNVTRRQPSDSRSRPRLSAPSDRLRAIYITVAFASYLLRQLSHIGIPIIASKPSFRPSKDITFTRIRRPPVPIRMERWRPAPLSLRFSYVLVRQIYRLSCLPEAQYDTLYRCYYLCHYD